MLKFFYYLQYRLQSKQKRAVADWLDAVRENLEHNRRIREYKLSVIEARKRKMKSSFQKIIARQINKDLFDDVLDIESVVFKTKKTDRHHARAWYYYDDNIDAPVIILVLDQHETVADMRASLIHELIHYWQDSIAECSSLCHNGKTFRYWKRKACDLYGLKYNRYF